MATSTSGRLAGKNAVITGGTTGLGFATAKAFLQEGARVLITGQNEERLAAAVRSLARTLAAELSPKGIRVNSISPGLVPTQFQSKMGVTPEQVEQFYGYVRSVSPLGRIGEPEEIARTVVFLASEDSSYMTASDLVVDGGYSGV